ncbi:MAG: M4 family metallopeptidase [Chitinophagales bacterium]|nr:M4 family metallopeptidase [Chitinophagales bacterium]
MITKTSIHFWLTVVIVSLSLIAACTAKLQRRSKESDNATTSTNQTAPIASAKAEERIDTTLTLEKLIRKDYPRSSVLTNEYNLDTAITNHLPHFNALELFTYYRFLFDLAKEDSMACDICSDTFQVTFNTNYYYRYHYKGIPVQGSYINVQTFYNSPKIDRINVAFKRLHNIDVTPTKTPEELAPKAILRLDIAQQELNSANAGYVRPIKERKYSVNELLHNYRGLTLSPEGKLGHIFGLDEWYVVAYEKGGVRCKFTSDFLCETCNFSTSTYSTQTVPTYHNANFVYGTNGEVSLEVQTCNQTLADGNMVKRYRLQQSANPFHVVYYADASTGGPPTRSYEEADWYSVPNLSDIDPATTIKDIKTLNGIISATITGITNPNVTGLTNNAITQHPVTYTNNCSNNLPIAIGATAIPTGMSVTADPIGKKIFLTLPTTKNYATVTPEYEISIAGGSNYRSFSATPLDKKPNNGKYALQDLFVTASTYPFSWGNYAVLVHQIGTNKYYAFNNIRLAPDASMQPKANLVTYCLDETHTFFSNGGGIVNGSSLNFNQPAAATTFSTNITTTANNVTNPKKFPVYLGEGQRFDPQEVGPLYPLSSYPNGALKYSISSYIAGEDVYTLSMDAVAHEYVHGIDKNAKALGGPGDNMGSLAETVAIEEGLCDILGVVAEGTIVPIDWILGNDVYPAGNSSMRNFIDPNSTLNASTYQGRYARGDSGYPNSTVISHWFYLLSQGGNGTNDNGCAYNLTGVGLDIATKIAYRTLTEKVEGTETMAMFADHAISAAVDIANGNACDPIVVKTAKALSAVGLSPTNCSCTGYTPCAANHSKLPRIDKVIVSGGGKVYVEQKVVWKNEGGVAKMCFEHQKNKLPIPAGANITISVTTSEKMANLNFVGFKNGATTYNSTSDTWALDVDESYVYDDNTIWEFALTGVNLPSSPTTPYQLLFTGTDMQGDALERMQEYSGFPCNINYNQIPVYNGSGWSPAAKPASTTTPHAVFDVLIADCSSSPETDLCDNHLPYLRKMHAQDGGSVAAEQEWIQTGNNLCLTDSYPDGYTDFVNDLDITVTASEPLAELHLHALSLGNLYYDLSNTTHFSVTTPNSIDGGITWTMTMQQNQPIISNAYSPDNVYLLHFSGSDLAGNSLEVMQNYTSYDATNKCVAVSDMPFRTADGGWTSSSAGIDNTFWLNIDYCPLWSFDVLFNAGMGITLSTTPSNTIASWELVDNETGLSTSHTLANANDNIAYYFDETSFALPEDFTLRVTNTSGCIKVIELTTPTANCSKPNINALVNSISTAGNQSILSVQMNLSTFVPPCQVFITQGSSSALNIVLANTTTPSPTEFTVTIPTSELCNGIGYFVKDINNCTASGVLKNDLFLRDNLWDGLNNEPNITAAIPIPGTANTWSAIWESPDLWNSYTFTIPSLSANQDPSNEKIDYDMSNYLNIRLFSANNYSCTTGKIKLYWTVASTGEMWSEHWIDNDGIANCKVGDLMGEINITEADYPIPAAGKIFNIPWTPPVFPDVVDGCDMANVNNFIIGQTNKSVEMCLLARFESDQDPIKNESEGYVTYNILNSNNIVTRNTIYLYAPAGNSPTGVPSVVYIRNNNNYSANLNVVAQNLLKPTAQQQSQYYIEFVLSENFWDRWTSNGQQSVGVQIIEPKVVRVIDFTTAKLIGVPLLANEALPIGVRLRSKTGGKTTNYAPESEQVNFYITHEATDPNVTITPPSTCVFHAAKESQPMALGNNTATQLSVVPNPNNGIAILYYTLTSNSSVNISLYNAQGKQVKILLSNAEQVAGRYTQTINTPELPAGLYLCTIETDSGTSVTKWVKF